MNEENNLNDKDILITMMHLVMMKRSSAEMMYNMLNDLVKVPKDEDLYCHKELNLEQ